MKSNVLLMMFILDTKIFHLQVAFRCFSCGKSGKNNSSVSVKILENASEESWKVVE